MADEYELSPDERLCHDVMDAISRSEPIRASSLDGIRVKATNETVELKGIIASEALSYVAEQLARTVPGVKAVVNHLATNEGLERHVAMALASDESTRHQRVAVRVVEGAVFLYGAVASQVEADGIVALASTAADGLKVQSRLQLLPSGEPVILLWQNSLEGRGEAAAAKPAQAPAPPAGEPGPQVTPSEVPPPAAVGGAA